MILAMAWVASVTMSAGLVLVAGCVGDAVADVFVEQADRDVLQRAVDCGDLLQHVDAVGVLLDLALWSAARRRFWTILALRT